MAGSPLSPSSPAVTLREPRSGAVDWLRYLALVEIAGFHSTMRRIDLLSGVGLPLLLVLTNAFNCTGADRRGIRTFLGVKARRLLVPWVFWCAVYAAMVVVGAIRTGRPPLESLSLRMLVAGTYPHLWFVPFALFACAVIAALQRATRSWRSAPLVLGASVAGLVLAAANDRFVEELWSLGTPVPQWAFSFPSICLGFALGRVLLLRDDPTRRAALGALALGGALTWILSQVFDGLWSYERYGAVMFLCGAALLTRLRPDPVIAFLTPLTLGVYLAHFVVIRALAAAKLSGQNDLLWAIAVVALSILLVGGMRRTPLRRFVSPT